MLAGARMDLQRGRTAAGWAGRQPAPQTVSPLCSLQATSDPYPLGHIGPLTVSRFMAGCDRQTYKVIFVKLFRQKNPIITFGPAGGSTALAAI